MLRNDEMQAKMELLCDPGLHETQAALAAGFSSVAVARGASVRRICVKALLRKF